MEQAIIGRIEQLPYNQKSPEDSGCEFFKRQNDAPIQFDREEFERLVAPLIEFLQTQHKKCTPYSWIIVRPNGAAFMPESSWFPFKVPDSGIVCRENSV